jgi:16S rRNA (guanine527-N7)-methyltransferase
MEVNKYPEIKSFEQGLSTFGIELSDYQIQQFIQYYELLIERNKVMNLTAITEINEVMHKHFIDSLSIIKIYRLSGEKLLDLGTGAGFPGIPLKIVYPDLDITLLDSLKKRLIFLDDVIQILELKKIRTIHGRAEDYGRNIKYREQFDICVSRAVANLSSLSEYCLPFVKIDGHFIAYKAGKVKEELDNSTRAIQVLGAKVEGFIDFILPNTDMERTLVKIKKVNATPKNYPRTAGKPSKEPL